MIRIRANTAEATRQLRELRRAALDSPEVAAAMNQVAQRFLTDMRRRFEQNSRGAGFWPDLAPVTKLRRLTKTKAQRTKLDRQARKEGKTRAQILEAAVSAVRLPILVDTGILRNSLTILNRTPRSVSIGTQIEYARYHQSGIRVPKRAIVVEPSEEVIVQAQNDVARGISRYLARTRAARG